MRYFKFVIFILIGIFLIQQPMFTEVGDCYCISYRDIFKTCGDFCKRGNSFCIGDELFVNSRCIGDECVVAYILYCEDGESNIEWFWKYCPENCEPPTE